MTAVMPSNQMWSLILEFTQTREDEQKSEHDLVRARKKIEEDLNRLGDGKKTSGTDEYKNTCVAYTRTLRAIESTRSRIKFFADQVQECIKRASQGKLFDDGEIEDIRKAAKAEDPGLYADVIKSAAKAAENIGESDEAAAAKKGGARNAGKKQAENPNAIAAGIKVVRQVIEKNDTLAWFGFKLADQGLSEASVKALTEVGLTTLEELFRFVHIDNIKLSTVDGLDTAGQAKAFNLLQDRIRVHGNAVAAEAASEPKPAKPRDKKPAGKPEKKPTKSK